MMFDFPVEAKVVLGKKTIRIKEILKLGRGAVLPLETKVGEDVEMYVNNKLVARGQVVTTENGKLAIEITEMIK